MKGLLLLLMLAALPVFGQTNDSQFCCRQPYRTLGLRQPVNLDPLFEWWRHQGSLSDTQTPLNVVRPPRPLAAWKCITGFQTGVVDGVWVIHAEIATTDTDKTNEWILLKNPPAAEAAYYYNLKSQLAQYQEQIANDARAHEQYAKAAKQNADQANALNQNFSKSIRADAPIYAQRANQNFAAAAAALNHQRATEQARDQAEQQLKAIPSVNGQYLVDCFALELGRNKKGQLVFDAGVVY